MRDWLERTSGILNPTSAARSFRLTRHLPSRALAPFVARYWVMRWALSEPYRQSVIPYPCVNLAVERGRSGIYGVASQTFSRVLEGHGVVFGVQFLPAGFRTFLGASVATLTDRSIPIADVFDASHSEWDEAILEQGTDTAMIARAQSLLLAKDPRRSAEGDAVLRIVDAIADDRAIIKVDDVARSSGTSKRTLERLFREYVGIGPKWVIQRYRLHEAAEHAAAGKVRDWADLAARLGYADQAHFTRDFKRFVGQSPKRYAAMVQAGKS